MNIREALDTTTTQIIPAKIDPEIIELVVKETPLVKVFKEIPWPALSYPWNERSAIGAAGAYDENDVFSAGNSTYGAQKEATMRMVKIDGSVSNLLQAVAMPLLDALQGEIEGSSASLGHEIERLYIEGNHTKNPKEFDGLSNLVTLTQDAACAVISLDILDEAINTIQNNGGLAGLIFLANRDVQQLHKIMRDKMIYNFEKMEVVAGVYLTHYRGIPILGSAFIPTILGVSAHESYGFVLDLGKIRVPVLKAITYEDMTAKVSTDAVAFRLKTWRTLAAKGVSKFHVKINALAKP